MRGNRRDRGRGRSKAHSVCARCTTARYGATMPSEFDWKAELALSLPLSRAAEAMESDIQVYGVSWSVDTFSEERYSSKTQAHDVRLRRRVDSSRSDERVCACPQPQCACVYGHRQRVFLIFSRSALRTPATKLLTGNGRRSQSFHREDLAFPLRDSRPWQPPQSHRHERPTLPDPWPDCSAFSDPHGDDETLTHHPPNAKPRATAISRPSNFSGANG